MNFKLISYEEQKSDNVSALVKGNYKSAEDHLDMLRENIRKEIKLGFQFIFDKSIINNMPDLVVSPCSIAFQTTIDDQLNLITKYLPTHNLSVD